MTFPQFEYGFHQRLEEWREKETEARLRTEELYRKLTEATAEPIEGGELVAEPEAPADDQKLLPKPD